MIILPRQARDRHRKTQNKGVSYLALERRGELVDDVHVVNHVQHHRLRLELQHVLPARLQRGVLGQRVHQLLLDRGQLRAAALDAGVRLLREVDVLGHAEDLGGELLQVEHREPALERLGQRLPHLFLCVCVSGAGLCLSFNHYVCPEPVLTKLIKMISFSHKDELWKRRQGGGSDLVRKNVQPFLNLSENASLFEFSLRLSRTCLGEKIAFMHKWRKKTRFPHLLGDGDVLRQRHNLARDRAPADKNRRFDSTFLTSVPSLSWQNDRF
jgi:hypothetical protein